jgi:hypothetical protein
MPVGYSPDDTGGNPLNTLAAYGHGSAMPRNVISVSVDSAFA